MGILNDIVEIVKSSDIVGTAKDLKGKYGKRKSIAGLASEGIMQFPALVTRAIDVETMQMVSKALEREYSTFVQIAISMNASMNIDETPNKSDFVQIFHQNNKGIINEIDKFLESYDVYNNDNVTVGYCVYEGSSGTLVAENKDQLFSVIESVRTDILNDKFRPTNRVIYNTPNKELNIKLNSLYEANGNGRTYNNNREVLQHIKKLDRKIDGISDSRYETNQAMQKDKQDYDKKRLKLDKNKQKMDNGMLDIKNSEYNLNKDKFDTRYADIELFRDILTDNDVKKSNELVATTLHIKLKQTNDKNEDVGVVDFIIGVKCTMHPVKSNDMILHLAKACTNDNTAFNFLRWTTGEINFFTDLLLNINNTRNDVVSRADGSSRWWLSQKRLKSLASFKRLVPFGKKLMPNASIVVSMDEINTIKSTYGFDLMNTAFVNKVMNTYFLLGFVVVDESTQIVHFKFDDSTDFESVTYSGLEKENSANERKFKEMLKALNKN